MDGIKITVSEEDLNRLYDKYTKELTDKAVSTILVYMRKIQAEARKIISTSGKDGKGHIDTRNLLKSVSAEPSVHKQTGTLTCEISTEYKYARFIHEGVKHNGDNNVKPFFAPFEFKGTPTTLVSWAERKGVIYRKSKKGGRAKKSSNILYGNLEGSRADKYYFFSKKTGKEYPINIKTGGLWVHITPTKFFEKPVMALKEEFITKMSGLVGGVQ